MQELTNTFIAGCFESRATELDNPANSIDVIWEDEGSSSAPIRVTHKSAQGLAAWWQGLNVIANDVAQLPMIVYRRDGEGKDRDTSHPVYKLLHRQPNPEMGPFTFKHLMQLWCASFGNAYAFIEYENDGLTPRELWPLDPQSVTPFRVDGQLFYDHTNEHGRREVYDAEQVFHLRGPGDDGLAGKSVFKVARDSLAVGLEAQRFGAHYYKNNAAPGIVLQFPNAVQEKDAKAILQHWQKRHGGTANVNRPALIDRGGEVNNFPLSMEDAQWLGSREFTRSEIASWLNLAPHKVGDLTHATFSNIEQQSIDHVIYSMMPWLVRWQDEANSKLFPPSQQETHFTEFLVDALLRGDYTSRMDGHTKALTVGVRNIDEVRGLENLDPLPNGAGKKHFFPLNMQPVDEPRQAQRPKPPKEEASELRDEQAIGLLAVWLEQELKRAYDRLGNSAVRAATTPGKLQSWTQSTLEKDQRRLLAEQLSVPVAEARAAGVDLDSGKLAESILYEFRSLAQVELEGDAGTLRERIAGRTKSLASSRPVELTASLLER